MSELLLNYLAVEVLHVLKGGKVDPLYQVSDGDVLSEVTHLPAGNGGKLAGHTLVTEDGYLHFSSYRHIQPTKPRQWAVEKRKLWHPYGKIQTLTSESFIYLFDRRPSLEALGMIYAQGMLALDEQDLKCLTWQRLSD